MLHIPPCHARQCAVLKQPRGQDLPAGCGLPVEQHTGLPPRQGVGGDACRPRQALCCRPHQLECTTHGQAHGTQQAAADASQHSAAAAVALHGGPHHRCHSGSHPTSQPSQALSQPVAQVRWRRPPTGCVALPDGNRALHRPAESVAEPCYARQRPP